MLQRNWDVAVTVDSSRDLKLTSFFHSPAGRDLDHDNLERLHMFLPIKLIATRGELTMLASSC